MADIIVAGNTSGAITISAPLVAGSGVLTLPTGTDTLVGKATTDTLTNKTLGAGTVFPAGAVLQVVSAAYSTITTNSTTTYADTGLTATITPTKNTSKILVLINQSGALASNTVSGINIQLLKNASVLSLLANYINYTVANIDTTVSTCYLDSPATTSATTYKTQFARGTGAGSVTVQDSGSTSTITLMEIAG